MKKIGLLLICSIAVISSLSACGSSQNKIVATVASNYKASASGKSEAGNSTAQASTSSVEEKAKKQVDKDKEYVYKNNPELTPVNYESEALLGKTADAGTEYRDKLVFICDSPTYWMWPFGLLGGGKDTKQIWTGPEGTQTLAYHSTYKIKDPYDGKEKLIKDAVKEHKPEYIVLALGVNGISFMDEAYFKKEYTALIQSIKEASPMTTILCSSIYPITPAYKYWGDITNKLITKANSWILECAEKEGLHYIDTFAAIVGDDGNAKSEYMRSDGLHPNEDGLVEILKYIRTHAYLKE